MRLVRALGLAALALLLALATAPLRAQDVQAVPALGARVIDTTGTLAAAERDALEQRLAAFEAQAGPQIVLLMVATTAPEDIAAYAQRVADTWKIGRRDVGDGVLVVVARDDRRVRIEVAKALEGAIPDLVASRIIEQAVKPAFGHNDYAGGIQAGVDQILAHIRGEPLPLPGERAATAGGYEPMDLLIAALFVVPILSGVLRGIFGNKLGSLLTGAGAGGLAWVITSVLWIAIGIGLLGLLAALFMQMLPAAPVRSRRPDGWGAGHGGGHSGGGGWGGGGGFSTGGGGDFGGGGASGSW